MKSWGGDLFKLFLLLVSEIWKVNFLSVNMKCNRIGYPFKTLLWIIFWFSLQLLSSIGFRHMLTSNLWIPGGGGCASAPSCSAWLAPNIFFIISLLHFQLCIGWCIVHLMPVMAARIHRNFWFRGARCEELPPCRAACSWWNYCILLWWEYEEHLVTLSGTS